MTLNQYCVCLYLSHSAFDALCFWFCINPAERSGGDIAVLVPRSCGIDADGIGHCQRDFVAVMCLDVRIAYVGNAFGSLGLKNGDAKIIKNAGGLVISAFDSAMRSLIVAIYELGVQEIMVVAHSHCGACHMSYDHFHHEMIARGVTDETLDTIRKCGIDLDQWLEGFKDTPTSVRKTVETIKTHPLVPKDIVVRGFIIDSETGELEEIKT